MQYGSIRSHTNAHTLTEIQTHLNCSRECAARAHAFNYGPRVRFAPLFGVAIVWFSFGFWHFPSRNSGALLDATAAFRMGFFVWYRT